MHRKRILLLFILIIAACAPSAPVQITELNQIVGIWKTDPPFGVFQIAADGETKSAITLTRLNAGDFQVSTFSFEDGLFVVKDLMCTDRGLGIYELQRLSTGNLKFTLIEDDCTERTYIFVGQNVEPIINVEFQRVE